MADESTTPQTAAEDDSAPAHAPGESLARIVRLSQERGTVQMDRNTGNGFEQATANMPLVQNVRLRTGQGLAEVEFEDNTSLRLTPETEVDFPQLKLKDGARITVVDITHGSLYVSMAATRDNNFEVRFAEHTLTLSPSAHVHLFVGKPETRLTVISGEARVVGPNGVTVAEKKQTITLDTGGAKPPVVAKGLIHDDYDAWDKNEVDYQKRYALASGFGQSPYGYGLADLNYYGSFINTGGCGQMWQPYLVGAGWSPYSAGLWAWYPGAGYSWVSIYPWGWTPFHSGQWAFCQGSGWGWRPTGGWNGLSNLRRLQVTGTGTGTPIKPPPPPRPRQPTLTFASTSGTKLSSLPVSGLRDTGQFVFTSNSAGLGVPRGSFDHLGKISANVQQHGVVTTTPSFHVMDTVTASSVAPNGGRAGVSGGAPVGGRSASAASGASHPSSAPASGSMSASASHASAPASSGASARK